MLVMGMVGAAVTAAYMTRVVYLTFFGEFRGHGHPHESGPRILVPLYVLAFFAVVAGLFNMPKGFQLWPSGMAGALRALCGAGGRLLPGHRPRQAELVAG